MAQSLWTTTHPATTRQEHEADLLLHESELEPTPALRHKCLEVSSVELLTKLSTCPRGEFSTHNTPLNHSSKPGNMPSSAQSSGSKASGNTSSGTSKSAFDAAKEGDVEFLQTAVLNGVDVNQRDSSGERCVLRAHVPVHVSAHPDHHSKPITGGGSSLRYRQLLMLVAQPVWQERWALLSGGREAVDVVDMVRLSELERWAFGHIANT